MGVLADNKKTLAASAVGGALLAGLSDSFGQGSTRSWGRVVGFSALGGAAGFALPFTFFSASGEASAQKGALAGASLSATVMLTYQLYRKRQALAHLTSLTSVATKTLVAAAAGGIAGFGLVKVMEK